MTSPSLWTNIVANNPKGVAKAGYNYKVQWNVNMTDFSRLVVEVNITEEILLL